MQPEDDVDGDHMDSAQPGNPQRARAILPGAESAGQDGEDDDDIEAARQRQREGVEKRQRAVALIREEMKAMTWTPKTSAARQAEYAERFGVSERMVRRWSQEASETLKAEMRALQNPTSVLMDKVEYLEDTKRLQAECIKRGQMTPAVETQKILGNVLGHTTPEAVIAINIGDKTVDVKAKEAMKMLELARAYFEQHAPEHVEPFREFVLRGAGE